MQGGPSAVGYRVDDGLIREMFLLCYAVAGFRALVERRYDEARVSGQLSGARLCEVVEALTLAYDPTSGCRRISSSLP